MITSTGSASAALADSIYSYGATVDTVSVFGALSGTSVLNAGDDSLTFFSTADISGLGVTDAGSGADALTFDGLVASIDPSLFVDFETVTLTGGAFITDSPPGASLLSGPDGIFVLDGSTLKLGDMDDLLGSLTIDLTSTVIANGDAAKASPAKTRKSDARGI